jgi:hypothetical protein
MLFAHTPVLALKLASAESMNQHGSRRLAAEPTEASKSLA